MLATYISIRPGEMLNLKEGDIDIKLGYFIIPLFEEKRPKIVPMIEEDIEILSNMPRGIPSGIQQEYLALQHLKDLVTDTYISSERTLAKS